MELSGSLNLDSTESFQSRRRRLGHFLMAERLLFLNRRCGGSRAPSGTGAPMSGPEAGIFERNCVRRGLPACCLKRYTTATAEGRNQDSFAPEADISKPRDVRKTSSQRISKIDYFTTRLSILRTTPSLSGSDYPGPQIG
jgi:hypothetical protein